jgi:hypothetical protein
VTEPRTGRPRVGGRHPRPVAYALAVVLVVAGPLTVQWLAGRLLAPGFVERHRPAAEAFCRHQPEQTFRKYPLADETDPAPDLDAFEYCVAAYISHLPAD